MLSTHGGGSPPPRSRCADVVLSPCRIAERCAVEPGDLAVHATPSAGSGAFASRAVGPGEAMFALDAACAITKAAARRDAVVARALREFSAKGGCDALALLRGTCRYLGGGCI